MIFYVLLVAVMNLGLGFAVAFYFGRRYRELLAADDLSWAAEAEEEAADGSPPGEGEREQETPAEPEAIAAEEAAVQEAVPAPPGTLPEEEWEQLVEPSPDDAAGEPPRKAGPTEEPVETQQAAEADRQGPAAEDDSPPAAEPSEAAEIEACLRTVLDDTNEYLENRDRARGEDEAAEQQERESQDAGQETPAADEPQESQEDRGGQAAEEAEAESRRDWLTGIRSRTGAEADLARWRAKEPDRVRPLSAAMIDLDQFAELNGRYGQSTGNKILQAVAQLMKSEGHGATTVARLAGQRFLLLLPETDLRFAANMVERLRQMIERSHFYYHEYDIRASVSCAVIQGTSKEPTDELFARAEATLQEAKRYGCNRTFLHEGKYPAPVVPPSFPLEERRITL